MLYILKDFGRKNLIKMKTYKKDYFEFNNKNPKKVDFMWDTKNYNYYEECDVQAISLEYQKDHLEAFIILPKNKGDIKNFIPNLTIKKYNEMIRSRKIVEVNFYLTKFEINCETELKTSLILWE